MDYLQEELEGQRRLWSALLLGKNPKTERETETAAEAGRRDAAERLKRRLGEKALAGETAELPLARALQARLAGRAGKERLAAERALGLYAGGVAAADERVVGGGEPRRREHPWESGGEAGNPKALSRAVQRDARRYDGGFSLY